MKKRLLVFTFILFAGILSSCVNVQPTAKKEPNIIVIRNMSDDDLKSVYLSATTTGQHQAVRFGSVSPVPRGISQSLVRARTAPPLPSELLLRVTDKWDKETVVRVSIKELLLNATGADNEALVFIIKPNKSVEVRIEYQHQG
jgi:hypothetical protein